METNQTIVDIYSRYLFETEVIDTRADHAMSVDELKDAMLRAQEASYGDGLDPEIRHPYMWACKSHYYSSGYNFYNFPMRSASCSPRACSRSICKGRGVCAGLLPSAALLRFGHDCRRRCQRGD